MRDRNKTSMDAGHRIVIARLVIQNFDALLMRGLPGPCKFVVKCGVPRNPRMCNRGSTLICYFIFCAKCEELIIE